jgi:hypothetical protein
MCRKQACHGQPPSAIAAPTADFDHLRTVFGHVTQGDDIARHA